MEKGLSHENEEEFVYVWQSLSILYLVAIPAVRAGKGSEESMAADKAYVKVIDYVKQGILQKHFALGEKLPPERELAESLGVSRNSVREGLRILGIMGVIRSQQGAGNYVSDDFENNIAETMSMMYVLNRIDYAQITEFRHGLELRAYELAMEQVTPKEIRVMRDCIERIDSHISDYLKARYDKQLHHAIVEASRNWMIIQNIYALNQVIDDYILDMRRAILRRETGGELLQQAHRQMVDALQEHDMDKGVKALNLHFQYVRENMEQLTQIVQPQEETRKIV